MARLFIVSGPSGVGKGTILKEFLAKNKNVQYSVSTTTRTPREGERDGVEYFFVKPDDFKKAIENDEFLEWAQYSTNYYGTSKKQVENILNKGFDVVLEIELQGALQVMAKLKEYTSVFIAPPNLKELERRLRDRKTDSEDAILKRLKTAETELAHKGKFSHIVENDNLEDAISHLQKIYDNSKGLQEGIYEK